LKKETDAMDETGTNTITTISRSPAPAITVDFELYAHYLDDDDLTEDQKREILQAIWNIIVEFVSLGFGVHPAQQVEIACGKLFEPAAKNAIPKPDAVEYEDQHLTEKFENAADPEMEKRKKGIGS
jgi:hypothetical protein